MPWTKDAQAALQLQPSSVCVKIAQNEMAEMPERPKSPFEAFMDRTNRFVDSNRQLSGTLLCIIGAMAFTPDSLCVRKASEVEGESNAFSVIFYKYLLYALTMLLVFSIASYMRGRSIIKAFHSIGKIGLFAGLIQGISHFTITYAFYTENVAIVLVILAANPTFAVILSYMILGEITPIRTMLTAAITLGVIAWICSDSIISKEGDDHNSSGVVGILSSLIASIFLGLYFVLLRLMDMDAVREGYEVNAMPCNVVAGAVASLLALLCCIRDPLALHLTSNEALWLWLNGGFFIPIAFIGLTLAIPLITAPEVDNSRPRVFPEQSCESFIYLHCCTPLSPLSSHSLEKSPPTLPHSYTLLSHTPTLLYSSLSTTGFPLDPAGDHLRTPVGLVSRVRDPKPNSHIRWYSDDFCTSNE